MPGKYIKPATTCYAPSHILAVVCETVVRGVSAGGKYERHRLARVHTARAIRRRDKWSEPEYRSFRTGREFHDYVESLAEPKRCLYVVSPIASETLRLTSFFWRITQAGSIYRGDKAQAEHVDTLDDPSSPYHFTAVVLQGKPDIVKYRRNSGSVCWVSGCHFFDLSTEELAKWSASHLESQKTQPDTTSPVDHSPARESRHWLTLWQTLSDWWLTVRGGPWGLTPGQMAVSFFRSRLSPKSIVRHDDEDALRLEDTAIFGGRASTWFYGDVHHGTETPVGSPLLARSFRGWSISERIHHVDIRSMYPHILASREFPVSFCGIVDQPTTRTTLELLANYAVIASVELASHEAEYPHRYKGRIVYPVGRFSSVLCGDELRRALDSGVVVRVHRASLYLRARPFSAMATELIRLRAKYRAERMTAWELFVKSMSNTFGGKMAQRAQEWIHAKGVYPEVDWGEFIHLDADTGVRRRFRSIAGMVRECVKAEGRTRQLGSCFAYLTMYGRIMMREIRERLPAQSIISQDTDGLWMTDTGLSALNRTHDTARDEAGHPLLSLSASFGKWYSPKHYWTEHGWKLAGFAGGEYNPGDGSIHHYASHARVTGSPLVPPSEVRIEHFDHPLRPHLVDGVIADNGWVMPLQFRGNSPLR